MPLDDDLRAQIASQLQTITGKRILLRERVDPAILVALSPALVTR